MMMMTSPSFYVTLTKNHEQSNCEWQTFLSKQIEFADDESGGYEVALTSLQYESQKMTSNFHSEKSRTIRLQEMVPREESILIEYDDTKKMLVCGF